jgi:long-chain acyl-CoA synthetase
MIQYDINKLDDLNLGIFLRNTAEKFPNRPALAFVGQDYILYKDFLDKVKKLSYNLSSNGIESGDKVAIWGENSPNWLISYFAVVSIGAVAVPILPDFSPSEVENIMQHSEAKVLFVSSTLYKKLYMNGATKGKTIILLRDFTMHINTDGETKKEDAFVKFCKDHTEELKLYEFPKVVADDLASIIYTSGTTGTSKGVMLTHRNLVAMEFKDIILFPLMKLSDFYQSCQCHIH